MYILKHVYKMVGHYSNNLHTLYICKAYIFYKRTMGQLLVCVVLKQSRAQNAMHNNNACYL